MQKGPPNFQQSALYPDNLQPPIMQATNMQIYQGMPNGQIRSTYTNSPRMPYQQSYVLQNQEPVGVYPQQFYPHPVNVAGQPFQQPIRYSSTRFNQQIPYQVTPVMGANFSMPIQQIHQNNHGNVSSQQHIIYQANQQNSIPHSTTGHHQHSDANHQGTIPHQQHQKKRGAAIVLRDPNTGKDITNELLKKKDTKAPSNPQRPTPVLSQPKQQQSTNTVSAKVNAQFAAKVAAAASSKKEIPKAASDVKIEPTVDIDKASIPPTKETPGETIDVIEPKNEVTSDTNVHTTAPTETVARELKTDEQEVIEKDLIEEKVTKTSVNEETVVGSEVKEVNDSEENSEPIDTKLVAAASVSPDSEATVESEDIDKINGDDGNALVNGHEDSSKLPVAKKKKKQRLKDIESKDTNSNDLLSAFTVLPQKDEQKEEPVKTIPKDQPKKETTWEDKEKTIDKEDIHIEDTEPEVPQQAKVTVVQTEEQPDEAKEEKLQYGRDFLLQYQFNPICTMKPPNLPNIDIVLDNPHPATTPLNPTKRLSNSNDFMPPFMRQASGGRSSSGGKSKDRRGPSSMGSKPQKVISAQPQFEKLELKKSENAWVRPKDLAKEMDEEIRDKNELGRNVRSILNKLTPQKFKTLVEQMKALKINSEEKLEFAIGLIFEKAISEPGFSVAYANMCRVLTDAFKAVPDASGKGQSNIFRKILLNKCQKEFEKDKFDEKQMEVDRNKTFENPLERKAWLEELDYRELKTRRRTLGNIRFIGELFKLKMISEKIMHECILKLLRSSKQETLEEQLECLCKLLTTIGKDLDHQEAKPRMDQYFQQIQKIIEKKKISSRIRFALQDVQDLRNSGWVPRRDEGNPKTIDQIHREAQQKEKEAEQQRQQDKLKRSEPRNNRGGGRDSPVVRPSSDGWTNVPVKPTRSFAPTPVDASKFKIKKNDSSEVSLGPGGRPGAWSRGASGGTNSRSGSGSNTPTSEIDQKTNRYDLLSESTSTPSASYSDGKRGSRQSASTRKTSQGTPNAGRKGFDERSAVVRAVKDLTSGSNSRNQSPVRSGDSSRNSPSSSGAQTPVEAASPNPSSVDDERMRKETKSTVEEFFIGGDYKEATLCLKELDAPQLHNVFIEEMVVIATEKKSEDRKKAGQLISHMVNENVIGNSHLISGFNSIIELVPDLAVDIPHIYKYLGEVLGPIIAQEAMNVLALKNILTPLMQFNKVGVVMAETLNAGAELFNQEKMSGIWHESGLKWDQILTKDSNVDEFIKDKRVEYTLQMPSSKQGHASAIQEELLTMLKAKTHYTKVMDFIDGELDKEQTRSPEFIRELTYTVCHSVTNKDCKCEKENLKDRKNILLKYISGNKDLELQAAYGLQQLVTDLNHPRGLLTEFFGQLYDGDIISEDSFYTWENSKDFPDGKGNALSDVKAFLSWLRKADEESNEEDSPTAAGLN